MRKTTPNSKPVKRCTGNINPYKPALETVVATPSVKLWLYVPQRIPIAFRRMTIVVVWCVQINNKYKSSGCQFYYRIHSFMCHVSTECLIMASATTYSFVVLTSVHPLSLLVHVLTSIYTRLFGSLLNV